MVIVVGSVDVYATDSCCGVPPSRLASAVGSSPQHAYAASDAGTHCKIRRQFFCLGTIFDNLFASVEANITIPDRSNISLQAMTSIRSRQSQREAFHIHDDEREIQDSEPEQDPDHSMGEEDDTEHAQDDGDDFESSDEDEEVDSMVQEDIEKFQEGFVGIRERFRLIKRIGEGN